MSLPANEEKKQALTRSLKVYLVDPQIEIKGKYYPDVTPHYVKSYLEKFCQPITVEFIDLSHFSEKDFLKKVIQDPPDMAGINCSSPNRFKAIDLAEAIKKISPSTHLAMMGPHATFLYEQMLKSYPFIDTVVRGEAEETFSELVDHLRGGKRLEEIKGLCFRRDGEIVANERRPFAADLDKFPFPEHVIYSLKLKGKIKKAAVVKTSRGCDGGCKFCTAPSYAGLARFRSTASIMEELTMLVERKGVEFIHFYDDTFTDDAARVYEICDAIKKRGLKIWWQGFARANTLDRPLLEAMKEAGCVKIAIGIESGSQTILERLGKKTDMRRVYSVCKDIKELKILLHTCLIVGSPGENNATVEETKKLIRIIKPESFSISRYIYLFPGTALSKEYQRKGGYDEAQWLDRNMAKLTIPEHKDHDVIRWHWDVLFTCWLNLSLAGKFGYVQDIFKWFDFLKLVGFLRDQIASRAHFKLAPSRKARPLAASGASR